jgi:hypothetical protein
MVVRRDGHN